MSGFEKIKFRGKFRDYQQRVLENADKYLSDGKINIVAAPGSGKTVLGLELICRQAAPCIIFSPTTAIRQQWGERLKELFLENPEDFDSVFSNDLHKVKLLTSVTYQALYSAMDHRPADEPEEADCSDVDIIAAMKAFGIKTVCLDEAHHLKNEWQRALEKFISKLDEDVTVISLTATPPYDSEGSEWSRYMNVCGEIDEEIFVPELVAQDSLCPHQDYVYFNYTTEEESRLLLDYKQRALAAVDELGKLPLFSRLCTAINESEYAEQLFPDPGSFAALCSLLEYYGFELRKKLLRKLRTKSKRPTFTIKTAEKAIQFLLDDMLLPQADKDDIISVLKSFSVYEKKRAQLELSDKLKRRLISSAGKLQSIKTIAENELSAMGKNLRMLILTDYIRKEQLATAAATEEFTAVNVVSIFETLRRAQLSANLAVLSGSLIILPKVLVPEGTGNTQIPDTDYCAVDFGSTARQSIDYVGRLFSEGRIQILIGTKSLLGEGWDSPCINSLVIASFVGSFVLSNQMRGRAIRIDKNAPDKAANIWHLVSVEPVCLPEESACGPLMPDSSQLVSYDFEILKRRFESFMGPNYESGVIESGIGRLSLIKPPFDREGIERINREMLSLSGHRAELKKQWRGQLAGNFSVSLVTDIPNEQRLPVFNFKNVAGNSLLWAAELSMLQPVARLVAENNIALSSGVFAAMFGIGVLLFHGTKKLVLHFNPAQSIKALGTAVYETLKDCGLISPEAEVEAKGLEELKLVSVQLANASVHDQNMFNRAMSELLSPIDAPRYILVSRSGLNRYNHELSFACPSVIGKKKSYVQVLAKKLKASAGRFEPVYVHSEEGRALLLKCRRLSYVSRNERALPKKYKLNK